MWVRVRGCSVQKAGNHPDENEDSFHPRHVVHAEARYLRVAIADGATESSYSREWAEELVRGYGRGRLPPARFDSGLGRLQNRWQARVGNRPLPWYAQEKLRQGAFSTLVGLTIAGDPSRGAGGHWAAMAAGDSCLFHLRAGRIERSFPMVNADDFSNHPALLPSRREGHGTASALTVCAHGMWQPGDIFLLATDALAHWVLRSAARPTRVLGGLMSAMSSDGEFHSWVTGLRTSGKLRNDDVTAVVVSVNSRPVASQAG